MGADSPSITSPFPMPIAMAVANGATSSGDEKGELEDTSEVRELVYDSDCDCDRGYEKVEEEELEDEETFGVSEGVGRLRYVDRGGGL